MINYFQCCSNFAFKFNLRRYTEAARCCYSSRSARRLPRGRAVQVDPVKPVLKGPGAKRLKLKSDKQLSTFAFKSNLRRHNVARLRAALHGRGLHSFPFQLNLSTSSHRMTQLNS